MTSIGEQFNDQVTVQAHDLRLPEKRHNAIILEGNSIPENILSLSTDENNFIKVHVYDDESQVSALSDKHDADDTLSAEEIEEIEGISTNSCENTIPFERAGDFEQSASKEFFHLVQEDGDNRHDFQLNEKDELQHVYREPDRTNKSKRLQTIHDEAETSPISNETFEFAPTCVTQAISSDNWYGMYGTPLALPHSGVPPPAAAIQSNFAQTMTQFAPSIVTCNMGEIIPTTQLSQGPLCSTPVHQIYDKQIQQVATGAGLPFATRDGNIMYTPHPKNGYMFYVTPTDDSSVPTSDGNTDRTASHQSSATPMTCHKNTIRNSVTPLCRNKVTLNSSGEENQSPPEPDEVGSPHAKMSRRESKLVARKTIDVPLLQNEENREQHNQKERRRRARIKDACNLMRQLVPGMSDKTDKATVFEFAARYVHFLKSFTGSQHDKDFLMKYSPY